MGEHSLLHGHCPSHLPTLTFLQIQEVVIGSGKERKVDKGKVLRGREKSRALGRAECRGRWRRWVRKMKDKKDSMKGGKNDTA